MKKLRNLVSLYMVLVVFNSSVASIPLQPVDCQFAISLLELSNKTLTTLLLQRSDLIGCQKQDKCIIFIKVNLQCQSKKVLLFFLLFFLFINSIVFSFMQKRKCLFLGSILEENIFIGS